MVGPDYRPYQPYEKGDLIMVRYEAEALPLAEVVFKRLIAEGLNPVPRMTSPGNGEKFLR